MDRFYFRKLDVYQRSKDLVVSVYKLLDSYPKHECYALCDQLRWAVVSVHSNIAEGMGRISKKEKIHFLSIAYGSLMETLCQMEISCSLDHITPEELLKAENEIKIIAKELSGLSSSIQKTAEAG